MWTAIAAVLLILALYVVKAVVLLRIGGAAWAFLLFAGAVTLCVPVTWTLSDWDNPHVYPIAHYVGTPIAILTVPCLSFLCDLARRQAGRRGGWYWRIPLEVIVAAPAWTVFWVYFEFFALGWGWI